MQRRLLLRQLPLAGRRGRVRRKARAPGGALRRGSQAFQNPFLKESTLIHIRDPIIILSIFPNSLIETLIDPFKEPFKER